MPLLFISFFAGILTVLAPCILPVLPIIIGGSVAGKRRRNPYVITTSLAVAVVVFTLILKFSTAFINVPESVWRGISGVLIIIFGLISLFPKLWEKISIRFNLQGKTGGDLQKASTQNGFWGDVLVGLALGPVFSSCSPTYFVILASILPASFSKGLLYLSAYALGLALVLLTIALIGQKLVAKVSSLANPDGVFKRGLGLVFLIVGILILTGTDRAVQTYLVEKGYYNAGNIEQKLLDSQSMPLTTNQSPTKPVAATAKNYPRYREIVNPSGFINSSPFKIADLIGKKVLLVDFMTYSCINCIRTFPYLTAWDEKYRNDGLEIIGIHTPEFAFEHNYENVKKELARYGIKFPVVLDNDYATWQNYQNSYWPRKYLIDIDGYIVYDHIGEGHYDETEAKIQELLKERMVRLGENTMVTTSIATPLNTDTPKAESPETYFGAGRNEFLANGNQKIIGQQSLVLPTRIKPNTLNLAGTWNFSDEFAENTTPASVVYTYKAEDVYFVASAKTDTLVEVLRDGQPLTAQTAGTDITFKDGKSFLIIQANRLYHILKESGGVSAHTLELKILAPGLDAYTFTFG